MCKLKSCLHTVLVHTGGQPRQFLLANDVEEVVLTRTLGTAA